MKSVSIGDCKYLCRLVSIGRLQQKKEEIRAKDAI